MKFLKILILKILILIIIVVPLTNIPANTTTAQDSPDSCTDIVQVAIDAVATLCDNLDRHEACYGNVLVSAQIQPNSGNTSSFNTPGDLVDVLSLRSLRLSPLNIDENTWGVVEMSLQANIPASLPENITLVIFGDASLSSGTSSESETATVTPNQATIDVYTQPWLLAEVIGEVTDDQNAIAQARTEDGEWLQVSLPSTSNFGWIETSSITTTDDLATLDVIDPGQSFQSPMQAFYFQNGTNEACSAFPTDGLLIQTPEGIGQVNLLINEVDIQLGSTAFIQAQPNGMMRFILLEGHARVGAQSMYYTLMPSTMIEIPMDADMHAAGPPSEPVPYDVQGLGLDRLPLQLLDRQFVLVPPPTHTPITPNIPANNDSVDDGDPDVTTPPSDAANAGDENPSTQPPPPTLVTICHNGNNTITVDWDAWINAHSQHGDTLGPCP